MWLGSTAENVVIDRDASALPCPSRGAARVKRPLENPTAALLLPQPGYTRTVVYVLPAKAWVTDGARTRDLRDRPGGTYLPLFNYCLLIAYELEAFGFPRSDHGPSCWATPKP